MTDSDSAQEQLRVIRSLMERATIYRAISAPVAAIGGLLSLVGYGVTAFFIKGNSAEKFIFLWLTILGLTVLANIVFLVQNSRLRNEPFFSPGMKWALQSVLPVLLFSLLTMFLLLRLIVPVWLSIVWIIFYGLALLSTQHFAPRSLVILGWSFFLTGCSVAISLRFFQFPFPELFSVSIASGLMAATFGGYHLLYAALLWMTERKRHV